jgi:hypothetical protein
MLTTTLAITGIAIYGGVKFLRNRFQRQPEPAAGIAPDAAPAVAEQTDVQPGWASTLPQPVRSLSKLVTDEDLRKTSVTVLGGATSVMHLVLGSQIGSTLFILNGVGYAVLLAGHYVGPRVVPQLAAYQNETRDILFAYTGTTVVAYFIQRGVTGLLDPTGMTNKVVELGMMGLLWLEKDKAAEGEANANSSEAGIPIPVPASSEK